MVATWLPLGLLALIGPVEAWFRPEDRRWARGRREVHLG